MRLGVIFFNKGDLEPAEVQFVKCLELAKQMGSLRHQAWLTGIVGLLRYHRGPREEAGSLFEQAAEWQRRLDDRYMFVQTLIWQAQWALADGDAIRALRILREAGEVSRDVAGTILVIAIARYTAEALAYQQRAGEAREVIAAARTKATEDSPEQQAHLLIGEAFAALAAGDEATARRDFGQALPIFQAQHAHTDLGEARLAFARMLEAVGDHTLASDQLERARELFAGMGANAMVAYADEHLARIRDAALSGATKPAGSDLIS
jgi:tetratricopeptide (TPR) repeat protein